MISNNAMNYEDNCANISTQHIPQHDEVEEISTFPEFYSLKLYLSTEKSFL